MSGPEAPLKPAGRAKGEKPWQSKHRIVCTCDRTKSPRSGTTCAPTCPSRPSPDRKSTRLNVKQELDDETAYVDIPEAVLEMYKVYRPSPLCRAYNLERALNTPAKIYYKFEGNNTSGSHKLNSAIAQAYYAKAQELDKITTETGAGQWGTALAEAAAHFGVGRGQVILYGHGQMAVQVGGPLQQLADGLHGLCLAKGRVGVRHHGVGSEPPQFQVQFPCNR